MKHLLYLRYILIHKWFVLVACWRRGLYIQGIVHDWSKFLPSEWLPYADYFYGFRPTDEDRRQARVVLGYDCYPSDEWERARFDRAWLAHQNRNPHHWQHWVLRNDDGTTVALKMPHRYVLEMLADWEGAGRAITGKSGGTPQWYERNRDKMVMHDETRAFVDKALNYDSCPF